MQSGSRATSGGVFLKSEFEGFHEIREEQKEDERDLNENEQRLLDLFKQNDEEIDDMLDQVIVGVKNLGHLAEDMEKQIDQQKKLIDKINSRAERARAGLVRENDLMHNLLEKYRSSNKLWKDIILLLIFLALVYANAKVLQWKGWLPA